MFYRVEVYSKKDEMYYWKDFTHLQQAVEFYEWAENIPDYTEVTLYDLKVSCHFAR